jgi:hypothetical protein
MRIGIDDGDWHIPAPSDANDDGRATPLFAFVVCIIVGGGLWVGLWKLFEFAVWG